MVSFTLVYTGISQQFITLFSFAVRNWAIPFINIHRHTPLLTRLLISDPFGNGFPEDHLRNSPFFVETPRKFTIFLKPLGNTC